MKIRGERPAIRTKGAVAHVPLGSAGKRAGEVSGLVQRWSRNQCGKSVHFKR